MTGASSGGTSRRRPGPAGGLLVALLAASVALSGGSAAAQGLALPRDEPEPMPEPGAALAPADQGPALAPAAPAASLDDLPDYGPPPIDEAAPPSSQPRKPVPPLVVKRVPRFKLTYQRFVDHRIGGEASPYNVGAVTFFPLSTWVRLGCTLRFGMEQSSGKRSYFIDGLATVGAQLLEVVRGFTPFVDFSVGPGLRMYTTFNNTMPSLQWTFGLDAGVEVYLGGRFYLSGAIGWSGPW